MIWAAAIAAQSVATSCDRTICDWPPDYAPLSENGL